ncbi:MAG: elongation factor Ts [Verrucomicrobiales bacterium]|jgi:elongation factor Ts
MAEITAKLVAELREKTNAGMMMCKNALKESDGDLEKAETILRKKGLQSADKKSSRVAKEGVIASYIHHDRAGVLIEVSCETDFVAKTPVFRAFVKDVTLHIAAAQPSCISREEICPELAAKEKEIYAEQMKGKPENVIEKILEGKMDKFYSTTCLLEQGFIKNPDETVGDLLKSKIVELGENIIIRRFTRYALGETE